MKAKTSFQRANRNGAIVALFAILLPLLVLILGFTVDYAYMQRSRNEIRVVSDLAAKAAADTLARSGGDEIAAMDAARFIAANNPVAGENITLANDQISFGRASKQADGSYLHIPGLTPANSVQVHAKRDSSTAEGPIASFFGQFYNRPTFDVGQISEASFRDVQIILVLDRSSSMKYPLIGPEPTGADLGVLRENPPLPNSRWKALDNAVEVFLSELGASPTRETVGLVTFANDRTRTINGNLIVVQSVTLDSPLSQDLNRVRTEMDRLNNTIWFGGTNITAGLQEARFHFANAGQTNVEKIIICLTDGVHNATGIHDPFDEATNCFNDGITVHTIQ